LNPVTRLIVSRTRVDATVILLHAKEGRNLASQAPLRTLAQEYFLYFPKPVYRVVGALERWFARIPLGGQYVIFSEKSPSGDPARSGFAPG
jgi:hypothetical protein